MRSLSHRYLLGWLCFLGVPAIAAAQDASIAGLVRDTSGAVMPGVTVEASSPVLIEKVKSTVSNAEGQYRILDLRPGTYAVIFTLPGFATVKREGIELSAGFTATVNAELRVGSVEETITVAGAAPMIDTKSVVTQRVVSRAVIDALPTAKNWWTLGLLVPGTTSSCNGCVAPDVGGSRGEASAPMRIHGGLTSDMIVLLDGLVWGAPGTQGYSAVSSSMNEASVQEVAMETGAISADTAGGAGGVRINLVPKDGGNTFSGSLFGNYTDHRFQGANLSDAQKAVLAPDSVDRIFDQSASFGGPIKRDRLWFFAGQRYWGSNVRRANAFYAVDPLAFVFVPDKSGAEHVTRKGDTSAVPIDEFPSVSFNTRVTWQATPRNRLRFFFNRHYRHHDNAGAGPTTSPDAATSEQHKLVYNASATYSAPVTNRLLIEAGWLFSRSDFGWYPNSPSAGLPTTYSTRELSTNMTFRSRSTYDYVKTGLSSGRAGISYVTGSHTMKTGVTFINAMNDWDTSANGDAQLVLLNGLPNSVVLRSTPYTRQIEMPIDLGLYIQDQWTIRRLTVNAGLRYDYNNQAVPAQEAPGGLYVGPRSFAAVPDAYSTQDIGPRLGVAYDLFGTGKTVVKSSLSRYVKAEALGMATNLNPINTSVNSATATWTDNGDFIPQANELGPLDNVNFGKVVPATTYADEIRSGWFARIYNWEFSASVQHQLLPSLSVDVGYFRRTWGNLQQTDNVAVTPADFDPFCITAPVDARLPGGGGNQICGLYDVKPAKFGQSTNVVQLADNFGTATDVFDGLDVNFSARFGARAFASGGVSMGREKTSFCSVIDNPGSFVVPTATAASRFCEINPPFQPNVKANGGYTFPWDIQVSATLQSVPGPNITATRAVPNAEIVPSLGRNLSAGARGTVAVDLIQPGTLYGDRMTTADLRVSKNLRVVAKQLQLMFDVYNLFNANPVIALNNTYGPSWLTPTATMQARFVKFGARFTF